MVSIVRNFTIICLVAGLVSCSATGDIDCGGQFEFSSTAFTSEQQDWIRESSVRWNTWVGYNLTSVSPGAGRKYCFINTGELKPDRIGQERSNTGAIYIDVEKLQSHNTLDRGHFEGVVMHEMGHALGYAHKGANGKALMAPAGAQDFTDIDRMECIKKDMCHTLLPPNVTIDTDNTTLPECIK